MNYKLINILKTYPFVEQELRIKSFKLLKEKIFYLFNLNDINKNDEFKYLSYLEYFERNWLKYENNSGTANIFLFHHTTNELYLIIR